MQFMLQASAVAVARTLKQPSMRDFRCVSQSLPCYTLRETTC